MNSIDSSPSRYVTPIYAKWIVDGYDTEEAIVNMIHVSTGDHAFIDSWEYIMPF